MSRAHGARCIAGESTVVVKEAKDDFRKNDECFTMRYLIAIIASFGGAMSNALLLCINPAIAPLLQKNISYHVTQCNFKNNNHSHLEDRINSEFSWTTTEQNLLMTVHLWSYVVMSFPAGWLIQRYGGKYILEYAVCFAGLLTLLVPLCARAHFYLLLLIRIIIGLILSLVNPAIISIIISWTPKSEINFLMSLALSGRNLATIFVYPITSYMRDHNSVDSWPSVFYLFGMVSIPWSILCMNLISETPAKHRWISKTEKQLIGVNRFFQPRARSQVPWNDIMRSLPVWAVLFSIFFSSFGYSVVLLITPPLLVKVLGFSMFDTTLIMTLPFVILLINAVISSLIADCVVTRKKTSTTSFRKFAVLFCQMLSGCLIFTIPFVYCHCLVVIFLLSTIISLKGINFAGLYINYLDIAPTFPGPLFAFCDAAMQIGAIFAYYSTDQFTVEKTLFYAAGTCYFISTTIFILFGTSKCQIWNVIIHDDNSNTI